jgi:hypothetical protein
MDDDVRLPVLDLQDEEATPRVEDYEIRVQAAATYRDAVPA